MTRYNLSSRSGSYAVEVEDTGHELIVTVDGIHYRVGVKETAGRVLNVIVDGTPYEVEILEKDAGTLRLRVSGEEFLFLRDTADRSRGRAKVHTPSLEVESTLPGKVVAVLVKVGDAVNVGDPVVLVDSMKMETAMRAEAGGRVLAVHVKKGDPVRKRQPLVRVDAAPTV